jgi:di/tricarboxylate transporter
MKDFLNILSNISMMFALSIIVLSSYNIGLLEVVTRPLSRFKSSKNIMLFWFIFSAIITGVLSDTLTAIILIPMALAYAQSRDMDIVGILLAVSFGSVTGNDLTQFGGNDTVLAFSLLQKHSNIHLNFINWSRIFLLPTILGMIVCATWLYIFWFKKTKLKPYTEITKTRIDKSFIIKSIIIITGIITILLTNNPVYATEFAMISLIIGNFNKKDFVQLPYKALYIWTGSYLLGSALNVYIKTHYHFTIPANAYTLGGIVIILIAVTLMTNFITNSGLTAFLLPIIVGMNFYDSTWLLVLVMKAVGLSYCTILANGCLAVSSSYGLKQKVLIKAGVPIIILEIILFATYFYLMKGRIYL